MSEFDSIEPMKDKGKAKSEWTVVHTGIVVLCQYCGARILANIDRSQKTVFITVGSCHCQDTEIRR